MNKTLKGIILVAGLGLITSTGIAGDAVKSPNLENIAEKTYAEFDLSKIHENAKYLKENEFFVPDSLFEKYVELCDKHYKVKSNVVGLYVDIDAKFSDSVKEELSYFIKTHQYLSWGNVNEQFYTWLTTPGNIILKYAAVAHPEFKSILKHERIHNVIYEELSEKEYGMLREAYVDFNYYVAGMKKGSADVSLLVDLRPIKELFPSLLGAVNNDFSAEDIHKFKVWLNDKLKTEQPDTYNLIQKIDKETDILELESKQP